MNYAPLAFVCALAAAPLAAQSPEETAQVALDAAPVWDGHNDVPGQLRTRLGNRIEGFDFHDTLHEPMGPNDTTPMHTDLNRLRKGHVGAQFWSVYVTASQTEPQAVQEDRRPIRQVSPRRAAFAGPCPQTASRTGPCLCSSASSCRPFAGAFS